jgi:flagellar hook-associated protein 3 FlgL
VKNDLLQEAGGDSRILSAIKQTISRVDASVEKIRVVQFRMQSQLTVYEAVSDKLDRVSSDLLRLDLFGDGLHPEQVSKNFSHHFLELIGKFNTRVGGRSLFSGDFVDRPAVIEPRSIIDAMSESIPEGASRADVDRVVSEWFDVGGGFDAFIPRSAGIETDSRYLDSQSVGDSSQYIGLDHFRKALGALVKGALVGNIDHKLSVDTQREIFSSLIGEIRDASEYMRAESEVIGTDFQRTDHVLETALTQRAMAVSLMNDIMLVDPYEAATLLQENINRLDKIMAVIARLSKLSLSNFL